MSTEIVDGILADPRFQRFLWFVLAMVILGISNWWNLRGHRRYSTDQLPTDPPGLRRAARAYGVVRTVLSLAMFGVIVYGRYEGLSVDTAILIISANAFVYLMLVLGVYFRYGLVSSNRRYRYMLPEFTSGKRVLFVATQFAGFAFVVAAAEWVFEYITSI